MATATFKFVPNPVLAGIGASDFGGRTVSYYGQVVFSAATDTYASGGMLPLTGFAMKNMGPYADRVPLYTYIESSAGQGWTYQWNQVTGKLMIFTAAGTGTTSPGEATNGTALNALNNGGTNGGTVFSDTVLYNICFPRV